MSVVKYNNSTLIKAMLHLHKSYQYGQMKGITFDHSPDYIAG